MINASEGEAEDGVTDEGRLLRGKGVRETMWERRTWSVEGAWFSSRRYSQAKQTTGVNSEAWPGVR